MAGSQAVIDWTSNDAQLLRTFQKAERGFDDVARRLDRIEKKSDQTSRATVGGFDKITGAVKNTAMALIGGGSLMTAIDMVRDANRKMMEEAAQAAAQFDELFRGFRVQAGLNALEADKAKQAILGISRANAVGADIGTGGARGLVGAGFSVADSTGAALNVLLRARAATNATGGNADDLEGIATGVAAYLTSQQMEKTPANLQKVLQSGFALRQTGAFELGDLTEMGKYGAVFQGKMTPEEQFATFGTLVDAMPAAEAGTAMRNIVSRLSTSHYGRTSPQALAEIGLKPDDVDLTGESLMEAMTKIESGLQTIPEEKRDGILKLLFEEAAVPAANILMRNRTGRYQEYLGSIRNIGPEYAQSIQAAQSGRGAASARLGVDAEVAKAANDAADDLVIASLRAEGRKEGRSATGLDLAESIYSTARYFGASQETALGMTVFRDEFSKSDRTGREFIKNVLRRVEQSAGGAAELGAPRFTTVQSIEQREARERELAELEAEWYRRRDARIEAEAERGSRMGRGFRRSGTDLRKFGESIRMENWFGPSEADLDALKRAMQENTDAVKENSRASGSGQQRALPSAALRR